MGPGKVMGAVGCGLCHCCTCYFALAYLLSLASLMHVFSNPDHNVAMMPGDYVRRQLQADLLTGLQTGDFSNAEDKFKEIEDNGALIVGDQSGKRWETEQGWISLDSEINICSQSKEITSLTIFRLIEMYPLKLSLTTKVNEYIASWPKLGEPGGSVNLMHLLSFTTGWGDKDFMAPGCARNPLTSWDECVHELSNGPFKYEPGTHYQYGPWHMLVAAAVAHEAIGQPLTQEAWVQTVKTYLYEPAGLTESPRFGGCAEDYSVYKPFPFTSDCPTPPKFPDFAGGLIMSGRQWQKIMESLMFGNLLTPISFDAFVADRTKNVTFLGFDGDIQGSNAADSFPSSAAGMWHYAQGALIAYDAAAQGEPILCGTKPQPQIVHSVGLYGEYVWMEPTGTMASLCGVG